MNSRNCHILCIEDEEDVRITLHSELMKISNRVEVTFATSRDEAVSILEQGAFFDYITLDLTIPAISGSFDKSPQNGLAVLSIAKELCPGTPVLILTGTSTLRMIGQFLETSNNVDIWSEGRSRPTVSHLTKADLVDFAKEIEPRISAVLELNEVELSFSFDSLPLPHDRLIRILAKRVGAIKVDIAVIGGGYSEAKVYSLVLSDIRGIELIRCVAKCGKRSEIDIDSLNFDTHVVRLEPEATPRKVTHLRYGASDSCAVFYSLASNYPLSFFSACSDKLVTESIRKSLCSILSNWHKRSVQERKTIRDIRRTLLSDDNFHRITKQYSICDANEFEDRSLQCKISCIHGDLHGENVLVSQEKDGSTLIDYGDVMQGCSILDPLTLECSFLFHEKSPYKNWPTLEAIKHWNSLEDYLIDCPYSDEIRFCREWIQEIGVNNNRELAACLYSYALRQLKYDDTDKEKALALIHKSFELFDKS
ncbi:TPA: response regulator [Proteus mirabilis]|nr:response regulator [Proteus mirabilis]EKW4512238.1 response regulator [Proteus mirabilis]HEJ9747871.1 response regulator [Proteus mirabilis]